MRYSYRLISEYITEKISSEALIRYLEILGLNPSIIKKDEEDTIFEIETPANRGYLLSLIGVAWEIIPFINGSIKMPPAKFRETSTKILPVKIENTNDCFYYSCRIIENVSVKETDMFLKERIEKMGYRSGINVVDISNYVMAETGQPLHIFDLDKIEGYIEVRRARKGETLITIDGKKREIDQDILVISDSKKVIAIAGIMGGQNSEVTPYTKNILIESAIFNPVVVRRGSKKIGLTTEASTRFERGISLNICKTGMARTTTLIKEMGGGEIGPLSETGRKEEMVPEIKLNMERVNNLAGIKIEEDFVMDLFKKLNFRVKKEKKFFVISPPSYRSDIKEEVDIVEEILKYRQYETVPDLFPFASVKPTESSSEVEKLEKIKDICVQLGFIEVVHMGITSKTNASFNPEVYPIEIENPLSSNFGFLRTTLVPEMLETVKFNIYHGTKNFSIFETGKIYYKKDKAFMEERCLAFLNINSGFFNLKGKLEKFFERLHIKNIEFKKEEGIFSKKNNLGVYIDGVFTGNIFILSDDIKTHFDLTGCEICGSELKLEKIIEKASFVNVFQEPSRYPPSRRDFSFIFSEDIEWEEIKNTVLSLNLPVEKIEFFDLYRGRDIPEGNISISFSVFFRSFTETLRNEEISAFSDKIIETLSTKLNGKLRGTGGKV